MEMENSKVSTQFFLIYRQSGDVLFCFYARRFRGYTATLALLCERTFPWLIFFSVLDALCSSTIVPHKNQECQEFTRGLIAISYSNHK